MGELINKVTLYDVISFTIPGSILLSLFGYFVFDLNDYFFKMSKLIKYTDNFYRGDRHFIIEGDFYYLEDEYLEKKYKSC